MKKQKQAWLRYAHLYQNVPSERSPKGWALCVYCGDPADQIDHVPPLSRVEGYRALQPAREYYLRVKCCGACNRTLGDSLQLNISDRFERLKEKLSAKHKARAERGAFWTEEELRELGPSLSRSVRALSNAHDRLEDRVYYYAGIKLVLAHLASCEAWWE